MVGAPESSFPACLHNLVITCGRHGLSIIQECRPRPSTSSLISNSWASDAGSDMPLLFEPTRWASNRLSGNPSANYETVGCGSTCQRTVPVG